MISAGAKSPQAPEAGSGGLENAPPAAVRRSIKAAVLILEVVKCGFCGKKLATTYRFQELLDSTESFL
jgi:hypothetical protein